MTEAKLTWTSGPSPLSKGKCIDEGMGPLVLLFLQRRKASLCPRGEEAGGQWPHFTGEQSEAQGLFLQ